MSDLEQLRKDLAVAIDLSDAWQYARDNTELVADLVTAIFPLVRGAVEQAEKRGREKVLAEIDRGYDLHGTHERDIP